MKGKPRETLGAAVLVGLIPPKASWWTLWANFSFVTLEFDKKTLEDGVDSALASYLKSMTAIRLFCETNEKAFSETSLRFSQILTKLQNPSLEEIEPGPGTVALTLTEDEVGLLVEVMEDHSHLLVRAEGMVNVMAEIYAVALFDGLLVDLYRLCLTFVPQSLATQQRMVSLEQVMKANDIGSLQGQLITEEVDRFGFSSVLEQFKSFRSRLGVDVDDLKVIAPLEQIRARRNIFVHNGGVVNESYLKIAEGSPIAIGEVLSLEKEELNSDISALNLAAKSLV